MIRYQDAIGVNANLHPYTPHDDACKQAIACMPISFEGWLAKSGGHRHNKLCSFIFNMLSIQCGLKLLYILLIFYILTSSSFITLSTPVHAVSWYARVGNWQIDRSSETVNFTIEEYCHGNITGINTTPRGMMVDGIHSRYVNIDLNSVGVKQRRSALKGDIKTEEYTNASAEAEEPITRNILKLSGSPYYQFNFTELWPVHLQSERALVYSGTMINDLELSKNNQDWVAMSFRRSPQLYSIRSCRMDLERLNISLLADDDDALQVEFLPVKSLNYSIQAFSSGRTGLSYAQRASDMSSIISQGEELFYGDYSLVAALNMSASNKNAAIVA